jgi:membrane fusion protein (multidrug efflux system)
MLIAGIAFIIWYYQAFVSTDDAYVNANVVEIAPRVSEQVVRVDVLNNQTVQAGQLLFEIDPKPFLLKYQQALANFKLSQQQLDMDKAAVNLATADVTLKTAQLTYAEHTSERVLTLVKAGQLSAQEGDRADANTKIAAAALNVAKAQLAKAQSNLGKADIKNAKVQSALANLKQAKLNYSYTRVTAPVSGQVANFSLRVGDVLIVNQSYFAIIDQGQYWVDANFKETQLAGIQPGQCAKITLSMYPNHTFNGVVQSISGGAGTAFSLLPPQNATGNWVQITQRVPVKIMILNPDPHYPLMIGTSASVRLRLKAEAQCDQ